MRRVMAAKETQRSLEDIEKENRQRKRMEVIREFIEIKTRKIAN
jgi:RNA polymerase primary sigma factor